jgi:hypothetical protein
VSPDPPKGEWNQCPSTQEHRSGQLTTQRSSIFAARLLRRLARRCGHVAWASEEEEADEPESRRRRCSACEGVAGGGGSDG